MTRFKKFKEAFAFGWVMKPLMSIPDEVRRKQAARIEKHALLTQHPKN